MFKTFLTFLLLLVLNFSMFTQQSRAYNDINWRIYHQVDFDKYIDVTTEEWKSMSIEEKDKLLQIPETELKTISTEELIETFTSSFYARNFFLHSKIDDYYEKLFISFNAVSELISREDVVSEVIKYYANLNPLEKTYNRSGIQACYQVQFIEYLIGNPNLVIKYRTEDVKVIVSELLKKYKSKLNAEPGNRKLYESNIYAISKLLGRDDTGMKNELMQIDDIISLQKTGRSFNTLTEAQIIALANNFVNN